MFIVDEATADATRRAYEEGGELAGVIEFRQHFPLITDGDRARVRWSPIFGQVVKLGLPFEGRTHDGQAEALLG